MACDGVINFDRALAIRDVANLWLSVGGSEASMVVAVAIARAESGLDPLAQSVTCATGLWQIEPFHAVSDGHTADALLDVRYNAGLAVRISQNGSDWEAWDTAYAAGEGLTRRYYLPYPEEHSAAWYQIPVVERELGSTTNTGGGAGIPTVPGSVLPPPSVVTVGPGSVPYTDIPVLPNVPQLEVPLPYYQGWDDWTHYYSYDTVYLTQYDRELERSLILFGRQG